MRCRPMISLPSSSRMGAMSTWRLRGRCLPGRRRRSGSPSDGRDCDSRLRRGWRRASPRRLVQQRLPDMRAVSLDQDDVEMLAAEGCAEPGDQLQSAGAATDHHDLRLAWWCALCRRLGRFRGLDPLAWSVQIASMGKRRWPHPSSAPIPAPGGSFPRMAEEELNLACRGDVRSSFARSTPRHDYLRPSGSIPLRVIAAEALCDVRKAIRRFADSTSFAPATTPAENTEAS